MPSSAPASVPTNMPPQNLETESAPKHVPAINTPQSLAEPTGPPLPEGGLPEGWTMEQWNVYGEMWLSQNQKT